MMCKKSKVMHLLSLHFGQTGAWSPGAKTGWEVTALSVRSKLQDVLRIYSRRHSGMFAAIKTRGRIVFWGKCSALRRDQHRASQHCTFYLCWRTLGGSFGGRKFGAQLPIYRWRKVHASPGLRSQACSLHGLHRHPSKERRGSVLGTRRPRVAPT